MFLIISPYIVHHHCFFCCHIVVCRCLLSYICVLLLGTRGRQWSTLRDCPALLQQRVHAKDKDTASPWIEGKESRHVNTVSTIRILLTTSCVQVLRIHAKDKLLPSIRGGHREVVDFFRRPNCRFKGCEINTLVVGENWRPLVVSSDSLRKSVSQNSPTPHMMSESEHSQRIVIDSSADVVRGDEPCEDIKNVQLAPILDFFCPQHMIPRTSWSPTHCFAVLLPSPYTTHAS